MTDQPAVKPPTGLAKHFKLTVSAYLYRRHYACRECGVVFAMPYGPLSIGNRAALVAHAAIHAQSVSVLTVQAEEGTP